MSRIVLVFALFALGCGGDGEDGAPPVKSEPPAKKKAKKSKGKAKGKSKGRAKNDDVGTDEQEFPEPD